MNYTSSYWVYHLPWKPLDGQRIYPLKKVLNSRQAVPAFELVLRQQFAHHVTRTGASPTSAMAWCNCSTYVTG